MKMKHMVTYAAAAASLLFTAACACTGAAENTKEFVVTPNVDVTEIARFDHTKTLSYNLKPGMIYICPDFADVFELGKVESNVTEDGLVSARIYGKTKPYSFCKWMFKGETPYRVAFRYIWFDKNGKVLKLKSNTPLRVREIMPGDPVRFSDIAPTEDCKSFCFAVGILRTDAELKAAQKEQKIYSAEAELKAPVKKDTSKQVKIVK